MNPEENNGQKKEQETISPQAAQKALDAYKKIMINTNTPVTPLVEKIVLSTLQQPGLIKAANEYTDVESKQSQEWDDVVKEVRKKFPGFPTANMFAEPTASGAPLTLKIIQEEVKGKKYQDKHGMHPLIHRERILYDSQGGELNTYINPVVVDYLSIESQRQAAENKLIKLISESPAMQERKAEHEKELAEAQLGAKEEPEFKDRYNKLIELETELYQIETKKFTERSLKVIKDLSTDGHLEPEVRPLREPIKLGDRDVVTNKPETKSPNILATLPIDAQNIVKNIKENEAQSFPNTQAQPAGMVTGVPTRPFTTQLS